METDVVERLNEQGDLERGRLQGLLYEAAEEIKRLRSDDREERMLRLESEIKRLRELGEIERDNATIVQAQLVEERDQALAELDRLRKDIALRGIVLPRGDGRN